MTKTAEKRIFWGLMLLAFATVLVLTTWTPRHVDDYTFMYSFATGERMRSLGEALESLKTHYLVANGRIFTNSLPLQVLMPLDKGVFNVLNAVVYCAFILGIYQMIKGEKRYAWPLLIAIQAASFLLAPVFGATVLWASGACNYLWGTTLCLYVLLPFCKATLAEGYSLKGWQQGLLCLGALMAGNSMENTSASVILIMALCILWQIVGKKRVRPWMAAALLLAALGYGLLLASPSVMSGVGQSAALGRYLGVLVNCMGKLLDRSGILVAYVLLASLSWKRPEAQKRLVLSAFFFLAAMCANLMMVFPPYYPQRATFGWTFFLLIACGLLLPSLRVRWVPVWRALAACLALFAVMTLLQVIPRNYDRYRQAEAQIASILQQRDAGQMDTKIFRLDSKSDYDCFCDGVAMSFRPESRHDKRMAKYFGVSSIQPTDEVY